MLETTLVATPRPRTAWLLAVLLVVVSAVVRFAVARRFDAPWIAPDEIVYALLGRSLWSSGTLSLLGADTGFYSILYPALIGLPLSLLGPAAGLVAVQAIQALLMSAVALVVFAWGRTLLGNAWALAAAALCLLIPGLSYTAFLMTEAVFYLVVTIALWVLFAVLVRPTPGRQALLLVLVACAISTRVQAVALVAAVVLAVCFFAVFRRELDALRRLAPTLLVLTVGGVVTVLGAALVADVSDLAGVYGPAIGGYEAGAAARDVLWHLGGVFILVAGIPLLALGLLVLECARGREDRHTAALVAVALAWTLTTVAEVGIFASRWVGHITERQLLTVAPPLFLVFALWLARGAGRREPATSIVCLLVVAPALFLPVARFATQEAALDAFTFIPLWRLREATSADVLRVAFTITAASFTALAILVPRRARPLLLVLVGATLALASVVSAREIDRLTRAERAWVFSTAEPDWIDESVDGSVTYLHTGTRFPAVLWKTLYWNEHVDAVDRFADVPAAGPIEEQVVAIGERGLVVPVGGRDSLGGGYVVAPREVTLDGDVIASYGPAAELSGLNLWRAGSPPRVRWIVAGFQPNGDVLGQARVEVPDCAAGRLELTLFGKERTSVEIVAGGRLVRLVPMDWHTVWNGALPAPEETDDRGRCVYELRTPGLVGVTRIEFVEG